MSNRAHFNITVSRLGSFARIHVPGPGSEVVLVVVELGMRSAVLR